MPAPRAQSGLPEWAKQPDIAPTPAPTPPPVAARASAPKNDGVIHVVQGAATVASVTPPPARAVPPSRGSRRGSAKSAPVVWSDPFADKKSSGAAYAAASPKKEPASRPSTAPSGGSGWNDPFADGAETRKTTPRRAAPVVSPAPAAPATAPRRNDKANEPAHAAGWKDPFTKAPSEPTRAAVAMRELGRNESSKWEIAAHHAAAPRASSSDAHTAGGWGVLKKRAR